SFSIGAGLGRFTAIVVGETIYGTVVGWVAARIRRHIFDARVEMTVSLMTPFVAYLVPQQLGGSGVLATLFAGMYIGIQAPELIPSDIRLSLAGTWSTLVYLLQGSLFLLTGLQFRSVIQGERHPAGLVYGAVITAVVVIIRLLWTWPAMWITDRFSA